MHDSNHRSPQVAGADGSPRLNIADRRPKIELPGDDRLLSDFARGLAEQIRDADLFNRHGLVFAINEKGDGLKLITPENFRTWCEDYVVCYRVKKVEAASTTVQFRRTMSVGDAAGVLASPQFLSALRPLEHFNQIQLPVQRSGGWIKMLPEGYDEETLTYTRTNSFKYCHIMPLDESKRILDDLFAEFPFADPARSKAVIIAAMLTLFCQQILPPGELRPCFMFMANAEGAGKTLLVKCATVPLLRYAPTSAKPKDDEEMRKVLLAATMEAQPVILFDNVKGLLSSCALEAFLTSQEWSGRVLGGSRTFTGTNVATVFVTGNGATVSPDMRRRSLFCELFSDVERAEDRVFKRPLEVPQLLELRFEILSALMGLVKNWIDSNKPKPSRTHSSFFGWSEIIGGIVEAAGYGCPVETPAIDVAPDEDGAAMRVLVPAIAGGAAARSLKFEELLDIARERGLFDSLLADLNDPATVMRARGRLAAIFKRYDRRIIAGYWFVLDGKGRDRRFVVQATG